jgi:hypothetical protein
VKSFFGGSSRYRGLHSCAEAGLRQKVSEPIGLGISFHRALHAKAIAALIGGRKRVIGLKNPQSRPWPVTSQLAELRRGLKNLGERWATRPAGW